MKGHKQFAGWIRAIEVGLGLAVGSVANAVTASASGSLPLGAVVGLALGVGVVFAIYHFLQGRLEQIGFLRKWILGTENFEGVWADRVISEGKEVFGYIRFSADQGEIIGEGRALYENGMRKFELRPIHVDWPKLLFEYDYGLSAPVPGQATLDRGIGMFEFVPGARGDLATSYDGRFIERRLLESTQAIRLEVEQDADLALLDTDATKQFDLLKQIVGKRLPGWQSVKWTEVERILFKQYRQLTKETPRLSQEVTSIIKKTLTRTDIRVLDFGSGEGELARAVLTGADAALFGAWTTLDPSDRPDVFRVSQQLGAAQYAPTDIRGLSEMSPKPSEAFDVILFSHVLAYIADPIALISELATMSRPGSLRIAILPGKHGIQRDLCAEAGKQGIISDPGRQMGTQQRDLKAMLTSQGAKPTSVSFEVAPRMKLDDVRTVIQFWLGRALDDIPAALKAILPAPDQRGLYTLRIVEELIYWTQP